MEKKFEELKKACEPVIKYLNNNHDPHTYIVVSQDSIKLLKGELGIPVNPFVPEDSVTGKHLNETESIKTHIKEGDSINKFEALKSVTDTRKFSELVYDIFKDKNSPQEIFEFLSQELTKEEMQTLKSIEESGYPLSLEGRQ